MKKLYFLLLLSFFLQKVNAQWVTIPDPNFVTFLQQNYPACMNGNQMDTTCNAIVNATFLNCSNNNIYDLTGIQYFDNLEYLDCGNNQLTFLPTLPQTLKNLACYFNQLVSLPVDLPDNLEYLSCGFNQLTSLPANLPWSLKSLVCAFNLLTSLPSLPFTIENLACSNNPISNLPILPGSLIHFYCDNCQLTNLPQLPNNIGVLSCANNLLSTLPTLPNTLQHLDCSNNQITSLPTLPALLINLNCSTNYITSLPELPDTLNDLRINNNINLNCLPQLKKIFNFTFYNTGIQCVPNYGNVTYSNPPLNSLPLCSSTINSQITSPSTSLCGVSSITLSADTGTGYSYQWQLNGNNISGAISQTYDATVGGDYTVVVTYNCALDTSNTITITSGAAPSAAITASGATSFCSGGSVTLNANTGTGLTYQWQVDGNNINGATSSFYSASNAGNYSVIVSNSCGSSASNGIAVTVNAAPSAAITASGAISFCSGSSVTLDANTGTGLTYQWQVDGNIITGAISASYNATATGNYSVMVSNNCGNSISNIISVTVTSAPGSAGTISGPTSFCRHTTQTFSVSPIAGATNYVWSVPPQANIISGAGSNSITVSFKVKQGDVTVKPANQCGAGPLSVLPVQVLKCANPNNSINSPLRTGGDSEVFIYPNPAASEVTIQFKSAIESNYTIKLYDIHGRIGMEQNSIAVEGINEFTFDVKFLSKGVYMIELTTDDDRMIKKLIVQ